MAAHARLFPAEYGEDLAMSLAPVDVLVAAANACGTDAEMRVTTTAEQQARDAHNRQQPGLG